MRKGGVILKILLIENDRKIIITLKNILERVGNIVDFFCSIDKIEDYYLINKYNLVIIGEITGKCNKFDFFKVIKNEIDIPVIFLVHENSREDILKVFKVGADDYITMPLDAEISLAKIKKYLNVLENKIIEYGETCFNLSTGIVKKGNTSIKLTKTEIEILKLLYNNQNKIVSKGDIVNKTSLKFEATDRVAISHIYNIRKKIYDINGDDPIENLWGCGYKWKSK